MKYNRLLNDDIDIEYDGFAKEKSARSTPLRTALLILSMVCNALLILYLWTLSRANEDLVYSPAKAASVLELRKEFWNLTLDQPSEYTASSGPKTDAIWDEITAPPGKVGFIKVQKEEIDAIGDYSVPFADGSGYLVTVDVFHQLHCLNFLRKQIFNKGEPPETDDDRRMNGYHKAHCIDSLRRYIQCHADTSVLTFKYIEGYSWPWPDFRSTHQCYNFDRILEWAQSRMVNVGGAAQFVHPILGPAEKGPTDNPLAGGKEVRWLEEDVHVR